MKCPFRSVLVLLAVSFVGLLPASSLKPRATVYLSQQAVWQFSVPLEAGTERRAYLWIPPNCHRVRGILFGLQNMLERPMFEDPDIRATVASLDMAIVLISPGSWPDKAIGKQPSLDYKGNSEEAVASLKQVLSELAKESGYSEIEFAPLMLTGHSAASPFIWGLAQHWPERIFAFLPFKGYHVDAIAENVPTLKIEQEWAEWGPTWGEVWRKDIAQAASKIPAAQHALFGDVADLGSGHFDWHHDIVPIVSLFMRKAVAARLPANAPMNEAVMLKPIKAESGVLADLNSLGTSGFKDVPYDQWIGDPKTAFWYFDHEMAQAVNLYMLTRLKKKPEMIDYVIDGKPAPLTTNGFALIKPEFLPDGIRFRIHAESLDQSPSPSLYADQRLGHADTPILYRVSSGALRQVGPDTFMVGARSGGLTRQGQPWEPWIMAYQPGNAEFRSADRPAHILIDVHNKQGAPQTITFTRVSDVRLGMKSVPLHAKSSSGLRVQYYVESGPAIVVGNRLQLLPIPPRSRYPVKVIVSAYQWGRVGENAVRTAGPETQQFFIQR